MGPTCAATKGQPRPKSADRLRNSARKLLSGFKVPTVWLLLESDADVPSGGMPGPCRRRCDLTVVLLRGAEVHHQLNYYRELLARPVEVGLRGRPAIDLRCRPADFEPCSISRLAWSRMQSRPYSKLLSSGAPM